MAGLRSLYATDPKYQPGLKSNFDVDYVIHYKVPVSERAEAEAAFVQLIESLAKVGFLTEVRPGDKSSVLVFTKLASNKLLSSHVYRSRVQDWLFGVRTSAPGQDLTKYFEDEPVSEAERLRLVYLLITKPKKEGGAGITPGVGQWKYVASVFPLHDHAFNRSWLQQWSSKYRLDQADLDGIRDKFGEQVAFYFAFLQSYSALLLFIAAVGLAAWSLLGKFSVFYAAVNCLWSIVFFEHWRMREADLAIQWGVKGVSKIQHPRPQFRYDREAPDPVTGEMVKVYSPVKRLARQLLQIPFAAACAVVLGGLIAGCFAIEIFITEVYNGPLKEYLAFLPTVLLSIFIPTLTVLLTGLAERLTQFENYETQDAHQAAFVQKIFVINFLTSYVPIFLTAFVYVPFGKLLVPHLDVFHFVTAAVGAGGDGSKPLPTKEWVINPDRLVNQVFYFTVTAQVVNFATEVIVPYAKRKVFRAMKEAQAEMKEKEQQQHREKDSPDEAAFLARVRDEADLDTYDVTVDYREMVIQFGYLSLFSVIWPLTACSFLVNNWVEARSDAMKIAIGSQRPIPWRADSIGPWLDCVGFLSWLGCLNSAALLYLFNRDGGPEPDGTPRGVVAWAFLLCILLAEQVYLVVRLVVRHLIRLVDSPGLQKERAERFAMRKEALERTFGKGFAEEAAAAAVVAATWHEERGEREEKEEKRLTREVLEEEARDASGSGAGVEDRFWRRQRGATETIQIGRGLISKMT